MQITKEINVELQEDKQTRIVHAIQYDTNSRKIKINLMEGAEKYVIETGVIATIYATKPSGLSIYNNCVILDNSIIATLTTQMLAENGTVNCQIELEKGSQVLTSFEFAISVKRSVVKSNAIESKDESTVFVELIRQVNEATTSATTAALNANAIADRAQEIVDDAELILNGDLSNKTVAFTQATSRTNIANGESFKTMFGKIQKFFSDLSATGIGAFAKIANNLTTSTAGTLLDASQGPVIKGAIDDIANTVDDLSATVDSLATGVQYYDLTVSLSAGTFDSATRIATWTISKDLRTSIYPGTKIKYTTTTATVYVIVHAITATKITFFHQQGITALQTPNKTFLSIGVGRPADFPSKSQWKIRGTLSTDFVLNSPTVSTNYLVFSQVIGVGEWDLNVQGNMKAVGGITAISTVGVGVGAPTQSSKKWAGSSAGTNITEWNAYSHQETINIVTASNYGYYISSGASIVTTIAVSGASYGVFMEFTSVYA